MGTINITKMSVTRFTALIDGKYLLKVVHYTPGTEARLEIWSERRGFFRLRTCLFRKYIPILRNGGGPTFDDICEWDRIAVEYINRLPKEGE